VEVTAVDMADVVAGGSVPAGARRGQKYQLKTVEKVRRSEIEGGVSTLALRRYKRQAGGVLMDGGTPGGVAGSTGRSGWSRSNDSGRDLQGPSDEQMPSAAGGGKKGSGGDGGRMIGRVVEN
jgi:hypothetical protein